MSRYLKYSNHEIVNRVEDIDGLEDVDLLESEENHEKQQKEENQGVDHLHGDIETNSDRSHQRMMSNSTTKHLRVNSSSQKRIDQWLDDTSGSTMTAHTRHSSKTNFPTTTTLTLPTINSHKISIPSTVQALWRFSNSRNGPLSDSDLFKPGDIVRIQNLKNTKEFNGELAEIVGVFDNGRFGIRIIRNDQGLFLKPNNLEPTPLSPHDQDSYYEELGDRDLNEKEMKIFCVMSRWVKLVDLLEAKERTECLNEFERFQPEWKVLFEEQCFRLIDRYWNEHDDGQSYAQ